ncbi:MAG: hypothetical protein DRP08_01130 [Candidatus Aenigmatarchaeota archaeon]|nr:MAG: hypothetical protein DRP08_01130 [Candidatus Aenigmarchaeota archaeon]
MAKITGVFTGMKGKVGNFVYSMWKGVQVGKTRAVPHNPKSSKQILQRTKFSTLIEIAKAINVAIIRVFWDPFSGSSSTGWSSFLKKNLLSQVTTDFVYSTMVLSLGSLYRTLIATSTYNTADGECIVTWSSSAENNQLATDESFLFWINEDTGEFWYDVTSKVARSVGSATVTGVTGLTAGEVHSYLWFGQGMDTDDPVVSDSQYLVCSAP